ncbi:MAG: N-6 DNA methylase [Thermodesulfobacteriota bacterium]
MLDSVTKKRIDDLRNILVGKIPAPQSQVEQITTGLIYKFMYDMDKEAKEMGGVPSFFVGKFEKYSWDKLFDPKLGGADKVKLYSDAIENMYTNPSAPALFREIFKNSFLPFKDPSTLNMFLKEINEFHYSHSEKLGDAFEYLWSFMGSQGDAGQFRTPRHIIDFIVEIVNPQKNETILDPACGTAGFLISSYKHILEQNTKKRLGDGLSAAARKKVGDNLVGYDISPDMTRISLVNMYLHQFASPQIHEYDTLSSEDRWNEYYDVILANPPFFSPTGGIQPHSRFGVKSTRAEVLFVDYIMEHLKPNGRAGVIVPEGIIFQTGKAYKTLRKKLVEDCLVGVISLPAGVFQPYSGVKTSILIVDKELNQKSDNIFFAKIENDGFSLGAQRTANNKDDIPKAISDFQRFCFDPTDEALSVSKQTILESGDFSLNLTKFQTVDVISEFEVVELGQLVEVLDSKRKPLKKEYRVAGEIPYYGATGIIDYVNDYIFDEQLVLIGEDGAKWEAGENSAFIAKGKYWVNNHAHVIKPIRDKILDVYLVNVLNFMDLTSFITGVTVPKLNQANLLNIQIPLPPIEVQQEIVAELDGYQKIIDGCRQVVENYKPTIDIDPSWEKKQLSELMIVDWGNTSLTKNAYVDDGEYLGVSAAGIDGRIGHCEYEGGGIVISAIGANSGKVFFLPDKFTAIKNTMVLHSPDPEINILFYFYYFASQIRFQRRGTGQPFLSKGDTETLLVPVPPLDTQNLTVEKISSEASVVEGNKQLVGTYTHKIQDRISKVWGD